MQDREVMYFLQTTNGIGNKTIRRLWEYFGSGDAVFHAPESELKQLLQPSQVRTFLRDRDRKNPPEEIQNLKKRGIEYYSVFDENYPGRLRKIEDCPYGLFVRGSLPEENQLLISIVGTRNHSYYGEKQTRQFGRMIAGKGVPIISGMARGIDGIAQQTAIDYGGRTYAVLGCGVDVCYPQEHKTLFDQIPINGGIISEYPPGTVPAAGLFPMRNRIISGLCDVLLVMEAREKSGTLITVDMALEQGKEIWVLPGRVDDALSVGCNRLIAQGAGILPNVMDFEKELEALCEKYGREPIRKPTEEENIEPVYDLPFLEKAVVAALDYQPLSLNKIYDKMDMESRARFSIQQVGIALMELCIKNMARQTGGSYYIRC